MTGRGRPFDRVRGVMRLEALHILRDRTTRALLVMVPAVQLLLFGYAVDTDPHGVPVAVAGEAGPRSDAVLELVRGTGYLRVVGAGLPPGAAARLVAEGGAAIGIELPTDAAEAEGAVPRVVADAADPGAVRPALSALHVAFLRRAAAQSRVSGAPEVGIEWLYNPDARTAWTVVPGLAGVVVMISMLMLGALTLVRERESGTWDSLAATPLAAWEIAAGKLLPYLVLGVGQSALVVLLARLLFALPVRGSLALLLLAAALSAACHLAIGFAVSAVTRTQMQAMQAAVFLYLPSMLLSGFMFPFEGMPRWAQWIGNALPLTHFVRAARDVLLRGADGRAAIEAGWLALLAAVSAALAVAAHRRMRA